VADGTLPFEVNQNPWDEAELKRLDEENRQLMMARNILKKVAARSVEKGPVRKIV
jgi:hypothetical protein